MIMDATATLEAELKGNGDLPISLPLELHVTDREVIRELCHQPEGRDRDDFALCALRLGVLALKQARGQVDARALKREGELLLKDVARALEAHQSQIDGMLTRTLREYFDPQSGRFNERIDRLLKKDGDLEALLARKITSADSEMCHALAEHIGEGSPIFRLLSPNESEGVLSALRHCLTEQLRQQREAVLKEFSLDNEDGALSRLVGQLRNSNGELQSDLKGKIGELLKQFSFDDEQSALSRMARTVGSISNHLTLDDKNSALSRLRAELLDVLRAHAESAQQFQQAVREALNAMQIRREEAASSPRHGLDFQANVFAMIQGEAQRLRDVASLVATIPGQISRCLVGDVQVDLAAESNAAGARVVVEAKDEDKFSLAKALKEIEVARQNRCADAGLFVFAKGSAPPGIEPLARYGQDVVVLWDVDDSATDLQLKLGFSVARALCIQKVKQRDSQAGDFTEMDNAIREISNQIKELGEIRTWTTTIQTNSGKILKTLEKAISALADQVETLTTRLSDLKQVAGNSTPLATP
jgi:hypothetical protein